MSKKVLREKLSTGMLIILIPLSGILALIYNLWKSNRISRQDFGTEKIAAISGQIGGDARENAEKIFEEDIEIEEQTYYKGSNPQKNRSFRRYSRGSF